MQLNIKSIMQILVDEEERALNQKILNPFQLEFVRKLFMNFSESGKARFEFDDFVSFIIRLLEKNKITLTVPQQHNLRAKLIDYFKLFDQNNDGKLDWNEYLSKFLDFLVEFRYHKVLKCFHRFEEQKQYLYGLSMEFLIYPLRQNHPNFLQIEIISLESKLSHNKHSHSYYIERYSQIQPIKTYQPLSFTQIQQYTQTVYYTDQVSAILRLIIQQRLPHLFIFVKEQAIQLLHSLASVNYTQLLFTQLNDPEDSVVLAALVNLTLLVFVLKLVNLNAEFYGELLSQNFTDLIFGSLEDSNSSIQEQALLLIGNMILWKTEFIQLVWTKRQSLMQFKPQDHYQLLYHSWVLSCAFGRYLDGSFKVVSPLFQDKESMNLWMMDIHEYFYKHGLQSVANAELYTVNSRIKQNLINIFAPFVSNGWHCDQALDFTLSLFLYLEDEALILCTLQKLKMIFKHAAVNWPEKLLYFYHKNFMSLLQQIIETATIHVIKEQAIKFFLKTLFMRNSSMTLKYLLDTNQFFNYQSFLIRLHQTANPNTQPGYYLVTQTLLMDVLAKLSFENRNLQLSLLSQNYFYRSFEYLLKCDDDFQFSLCQSTRISRNLGIDEKFFKNLMVLYQGFYNTLSDLYFWQNNPLDAIVKSLLELLPNQFILDKLTDYCQALLTNMNILNPCIVKRYVNSIYQSIIFIINVMVNISKTCAVNLENSQYFQAQNSISLLTQKLIQIHTNLIEYQNQIEDHVLLNSVESQDGSVVAVYYNDYNSGKQCKVVITSRMTLIDFEKEVERGLNTNNPLLYLVIDHHSPDKSPHNDSLVDDLTFENFKLISNKQIDTPLIVKRQCQEVIAVDLLYLKQNNYSMKNVAEIVHSGSQYFRLKQIQSNQILWLIETQAGLVKTDRASRIAKLQQISRLQYDQVENLYDSLINFCARMQINLEYPKMSQNDFIDFLSEIGIPFTIGKKISQFISTQGLNAPVDFADFVCFVALITKHQNDTIFLKTTFLIYLSEGKFSLKELIGFIKDMLQVLKVDPSMDNLENWAEKQFQEADQNKDGQISFFEFHTLLSNPLYREKLSQPFRQLFNSITLERNIINQRPYLVRSPIKFF